MKNFTPYISRYLYAWVPTLICAIFIILVCNRGFDFTDESYYIFWTMQPERMTANIHPSGILFNAIFLYTGKSIYILRVIGLIVILSCSFILGCFLDFYYKSLGVHGRISGFTSLSSLYFVSSYSVVFILTPSYNLLSNAAGCLIFAGSLGWASNDKIKLNREISDFIPSSLVGIGGCLAFFAKPTFAVVAAIAIVFHLIISRLWFGAAIHKRILIAGITCVVPTILVILANLGINDFISMFREGLENINFGNGLVYLPLKTLKDFFHAPISLIAVAFMCAVTSGIKAREAQRIAPRWLVGLSACVLALALIYLIASIVGAMIRDSGPFGVVGPPTLAVVLSLATLGLVCSDRNSLKLGMWWPVGVLLILPFATAFGTANQIVLQSAISLYAMLLALVIAATLCFSHRMATGIKVASVVYTIVLLLWSAWLPYGLPAPIWAQDKPIRFAPTGETFYVDAVTQQYALGLKRIAETHGLTPDVPIIDLSGGGPGTALLLNANAPYYPWIVHIFGAGSSRLADVVWNSLTPTQKRRAWFILPAASVFEKSQALQAMQRGGRYRLIGRLPMRFWSKDRLIEIWAPID